MNTTKLISFVQGAFYPVAGALLSYIIANLGASGLLNAGMTVVVTGLLSVLEDYITKQTGRAMFGTLNTPTF
jgi:hypothetical protein